MQSVRGLPIQEKLSKQNREIGWRDVLSLLSKGLEGGFLALSLASYLIA
jgi:hypothetical protein